MDEQTSKIVTQTIANLAEITARNTVGVVSNKIKKAKAGREKDKTINELEEIINELIKDKIELERLAKTLENELVSQQISDDEIDFIVKSVIPIIEEFTKDDKKQQSYIDAIKKLLSKNTLKVMQLIGFNYREAIGKPLTRLCSGAIESVRETDKKQEAQNLNIANQTALAQLSSDPKAYNRFVKLLGREDLISESKKDVAGHDKD